MNFLVASAEGHPVRDNQFDKAFFCESLYYSPDPRLALWEIFRALKTGGKFYCLVNLFLENPYTHVWVKFSWVSALPGGSKGSLRISRIYGHGKVWYKDNLNRHIHQGLNTKERA